MSKSFHLLLVVSLIPVSIPMLGCGGGDEAREVVEEYPGQFDEMVMEDAKLEEDQEER